MSVRNHKTSEIVEMDENNQPYDSASYLTGRDEKTDFFITTLLRYNAYTI